MIQRYDVTPKEKELYPQYYQDKYFAPNPNGRFIRWEDLPETIKKVIENDGLNK